jgi:hypothetical protein
MICKTLGRSSYVEQEFAIDHFIRNVWQKDLQLGVGQRRLLQISGVEFLIPRHIHVVYLPIREQPFLTTESITHELHRTLVVGWQVVLAFNAEDDVEILFGLHEVSKVRSHHL